MELKLKPTIPHDDTLLELDEFKSLAKVGRTTVFKWMGDQTLIKDVDYIKRGRVVRFTWPPLFLTRMKERKASIIKAEKENDNARPEHADAKKPPTPEKSSRTRGRRRPVDFNMTDDD